LISGPLFDWFSNWTKLNPNSQDDFTSQFCRDFCSYPSEYQRGNKDFDWTKMKKLKFYMNPGETKIWKFKVGSGRFRQDQHGEDATSWPNHIEEDEDWAQNAIVFYEGISKCVMIMVEGVPTHQNNAGDQFIEQVARSAPGLEFTLKKRDSGGKAF